MNPKEIPTPKYDELKELLEKENFEKDSKEYKLFEAIITALGEVESDVNEQKLMMSEIDEDLADVEDEIFEGFEEPTFDADEVFELECPHCQMKLYIDEAILMQDKMNCPNCGKEVEFDLDEDCGGSCNGCSGCH